MKATYKATALRTKHIEALSNYWLTASDDFLKSMGADPAKMPSSQEWFNTLLNQITSPLREKESMHTIWLEDEEAIGHCNVNEIEFGKEGYMHLHIWHEKHRAKGIGAELIKDSLFIFFTVLELDKVYCEPSSYNPAPNKTLEKIGFTFVKKIRKAPSSLALEQDLNQWVINYEDFKMLRVLS